MALSMANPAADPHGRPCCIVCGERGIRLMLELRSVPVHCNVLWSRREEALAAPRGDIVLAYCPHCGHVFNSSFDPAPMSYSQEYENSLHFSPRFQQYAEELADRLVADHNIRGKSIIELGCGQGDFLALLVSRGDNRGVGFDRSFTPPLAYPELSGRMSVVQDFYSPQYSDYPADLVVCRQVLEHIQAPLEFVQSVREAVGNRPGTVVFFEVPNVMYTLRDRGIWDLIYEHCSYFSVPSFAEVFVRSGFDVHAVRELYGGQFLGLDARVTTDPRGTAPPGAATASAVSPYAEEFASMYRQKVEFWGETIDRFRRQGKTAVVWGSGSKGVTFLNTLGVRDAITHVVDINPRKHGKFVAGTGQEIVSPEQLQTLRPDAVVVMNSIYLQEIDAALSAHGVNAEVLAA